MMVLENFHIGGTKNSLKWFLIMVSKRFHNYGTKKVGRPLRIYKYFLALYLSSFKVSKKIHSTK